MEFALGETRWDESGERIGTFLAVAQLDDGRADAALHGGPLAGARFPTARAMLDERDFVPVAEGLIAGTRREPRAHRLGVPRAAAP